jgi:hypothetical protein
MTPFFKAAGGNQIDVMVNTKRKVDCFSWGSQNGAGYVDKDVKTMVSDDKWTNFFKTNGYLVARAVAGLNLVICKATKDTPGTDVTGDIVVIPATQSAGDLSNDPVPGQNVKGAPWSSSRCGLMSAFN